MNAAPSARSAARPLRVGVVEYANTRPLIDGLAEPALQRTAGYTLIPAVPAALSAALGRGELDLALISVAEYLRGDYVLLDAGCIACHGPVASVRLFANEPIRGLRAIHCDPASRSGNALVRVLARHLWQVEPAFVERPQSANGTKPEAAPGEGFVLIGDPALRLAGSYAHEVDLGEAWLELTQLPFVFAVWAARRDRDLGTLPDLLRQARHRGTDRIHAHAAEAARDLDLPGEVLTRYLGQHIHYHLGQVELVAIEMFYRLMRDMNLVPPFAGIEFYRPPRAVFS